MTGNKPARKSRPKAPNRLLEIMKSRGIGFADLERLSGARRQQVHKLATGGSNVTRYWAERFAPHLGVTWQEILGWTPDGLIAPPLTSLRGWHVGATTDGLSEVRIVLADKAEAKKWSDWMFDRANEAEREARGDT